MGRERVTEEDETGGGESSETVLGRRSYLGLAGATAMSLGSVAATDAAAAAGEDGVPSTGDVIATDGGTVRRESPAAGATTLPKTLVVRESGAPANYEFTVDGELARDPEEGSGASDAVSGSSATGWVTEENRVDSYRFSGTISDFTFVEGEARLFLDGEEVTTDVVESSSLPHAVTVRGAGTPADYEFAVDGELHADPGAGNLRQWDNVDGRTAAGWVADAEHVDSYRFSGEIVRFDVDGTARIDVDRNV